MSRMLVALLCALSVAASAAEQAGVVKIAKGAVTIERSGAQSSATPGARVHSGDRIVTGPDGQVGITLRDNTLLSAGPNSTLVLDDFAFDSTTHGGTLHASVQRGTVAVVSGKIAAQSPQDVRFRTPNAVLGVRGTSFVIDAGAGEP
jgi:hypothetical protein